MTYELLLIAALLMLTALPYVLIAGDASGGWRRTGLQLYLVLILAGYFCGFWLRGGQTLAMRTWRLRVEGADGGPLRARRALLRFLWALVVFVPLAMTLALFTRYRSQWTWLVWLVLPAAASVLWARFDRDRQFLHDRLAGTRIALIPAAPARSEGIASADRRASVTQSNPSG